VSTADYQREWLDRPGNRERERQRHKAHKRAQRVAVIAYLGGECVRCGFSDWRALQIDHVFDDGHAERARLGPSWYGKIVRCILAGKGNGRYQLLCANCNWIKRFEADGR
jgi:hypothetical protein